MRLRQLRYFLVVARMENITKAAQLIHVSQPALSRSLKELEQEIGVPLFIRNGHSLKLNESGCYFQKQVAQSLKLVDDAVTDIQHEAQGRANQIIIRTVTSSPLLPRLVHYLKVELPTVKVRLVQDGLENNALSRYDFELSTSPIKGNINTPLLDEEILVGVGPQSPWYHKASITREALQTQPLILTAASPLRTLIESFLATPTNPVIPAFTTSDRLSIYELTAENLGCSFIPARSWNVTNLSNVHLLHIAPERLTRRIFLSSPADLQLDARHQQVGEVIRGFFESE
ncbi:LysR family transcriptional regulator [Lactiplantibacillus pentosus]|uniref:LysR family transcriptional regulator n=1 Tax=Lactiplantibacillus pentosus TaxID=1589 RepID=UPI001FD6683A|nr:LysR family transcriptional regulator [Lactiplantibacillus pentosus]MCJ8182449.1 LysR family transcriptional regulator [Lactiplantibacillus pentosus]